MHFLFIFFFFNDTATTEIYTLSLHDALPIFVRFSRQNAIPGRWSLNAARSGSHCASARSQKESSSSGRLSATTNARGWEIFTYWVMTRRASASVANVEGSCATGGATPILSSASGEVSKITEKSRNVLEAHRREKTGSRRTSSSTGGTNT